MALALRPRGRRIRRTASLTTGLVLAALALAGPATASAAPALAAEPTVNKATVLSAKTYPGIQLIEVDYTATVSLPEPVIDQSAVAELSNRLAAQALTGAIGTSDQAIVEAFVTEISKEPLAYFKPSGAKNSEEATLSGFGTGWVVTPDGYIVTAAHVVKADPEKIKTEFASAALADITKTTVSELQSGATKFTDGQIKKLTEALTTYATKYLTVTDLRSAVSAQIGVAVAGFKKSQKGHPVEVKAVGEPYPGKDVALLKLDGEEHLPTLPVGANGDVAEGDTLYVAGYPAASTFYSGLSKDSEVQPSITQGPLTAVKSNANGTPIFQTQAPASPGNSGGPVLDDAGKVVGVLVASAVSDQGVALEGQEFVIPISVVSEILNEHNVKPATSDTTVAYDKAVDEYFAHHYKAAKPLFEKAASLYQGHPYAGDYVSKSTAAIDAGKDETPRPLWFWLLVVGVPVVAIAVVGLVVMMSRRRKGGGSAQPPMWTTPGQGPGQVPAGQVGQPQGWAGQYPQPQPQQDQPGYPPQPGYPQQPGYPPQQYPQQYPPPGQYPPQ